MAELVKTYFVLPVVDNSTNGFQYSLSFSLSYLAWQSPGRFWNPVFFVANFIPEPMDMIKRPAVVSISILRKKCGE